MINKHNKKELNYDLLNNKINDVINYTNKLIENNNHEDITLLEDVVLTEMNDLVLGIESNDLKLSYSNLKLLSTHYIIDGAIKDLELIRLLQDVQNEIYRIKDIVKHPINLKLYDNIFSFALGILIMPSISFLILGITENKIVFWISFIVFMCFLILDIIVLFKISKMNERQHHIFPNLPYEKCLFVHEFEYKNQDMLSIGLINNYEIDLGYIESVDEYIITVIKDGNWTNIIEEVKVKKRYNVEKILKDRINEIYELEKNINLGKHII